MHVHKLLADMSMMIALFVQQEIQESSELCAWVVSVI